MLDRIGIKPDACNKTFSLLDDMIKRRHRIVHNADRPLNSVGPPGPETLQIDRDTVQKWRDAVLRFMQDVLYQLQFVVDGDSDEPG